MADSQMICTYQTWSCSIAIFNDQRVQVLLRPMRGIQSRLLDCVYVCIYIIYMYIYYIYIYTDIYIYNIYIYTHINGCLKSSSSSTRKQWLLKKHLDGDPKLQLRITFWNGVKLPIRSNKCQYDIWRFPEIGVPQNHPFQWDFPLQTIHLGYPHLWKPTYRYVYCCCPFRLCVYIHIYIYTVMMICMYLCVLLFNIRTYSTTGYTCHVCTVKAVAFFSIHELSHRIQRKVS